MTFKIETDDQFRPTSLTISNGTVTMLLFRNDEGAKFQINTNEMDEKKHYKSCLNIHLPEAAVTMLKAVVANL